MTLVLYLYYIFRWIHGGSCICILRACEPSQPLHSNKGSRALVPSKVMMIILLVCQVLCTAQLNPDYGFIRSRSYISDAIGDYSCTVHTLVGQIVQVCPHCAVVED